jgi:hypothetical protein
VLEYVLDFRSCRHLIYIALTLGLGQLKLSWPTGMTLMLDSCLSFSLNDHYACVSSPEMQYEATKQPLVECTSTNFLWIFSYSHYENKRACKDVPLAPQTQHLEISQFSRICGSPALRDTVLQDYHDAGILEAGHADSAEGWIEVFDERPNETNSLQSVRRQLSMTTAGSLRLPSLFWIPPCYLKTRREPKLMRKYVKPWIA